MVHASFYSSKSNLKVFSVSYTLLEKGIKEDIFGKGLKTELVDNFLQEMISLVHTSERIRSLNPTDNEVINNIFLPYLRGICTPKGLELMHSYFEENEGNN